MATELAAALLAFAVVPGTATDRTGALLGGFSSARWSSERSELVLLSDRGPGDGTVPYQPRLQRYAVTLGSRSVSLALKETIPLRDADGAAFSGLIKTPLPRLDPEGLVLDPDGGFWISDEYGPSVRRFDSKGRQSGRLEVPAEFAPGPARGRTDNQGFEGLCLSPDGRALYAVLQSPLAQDGGREGSHSRVLGWEKPWSRAPARSWSLERADPAAEGLAPSRRETGLNECAALSRTTLLVLERDGRGAGEPAPRRRAAYKRAVTVSLREDGVAVRGRELDLLKPLVAAGFAPERVPPKFESLEPGPVIEGRRTLWVVLDNDFKPGIPTYVFLLALGEKS